MNQRIADLLIDPRESLNVEIKGWLDLLSSNDDKATLAKAILAIGNHGGGFIVVGLREEGAAVVPAPDRPAALTAYTQDQVNGIVQSYVDPPFHCAVHHVAGPDGLVHPVVVVPGGHRVPVRAKRGSPNNTTLQTNAIYIRRPGPRSETPQSAQDWDDLLGRCLAARRDELLDHVRGLLSGAASLPAVSDPGERLAAWTATCLARWQELRGKLAMVDRRRCPKGFHYFSYELRGTPRSMPVIGFLDLLRRSVVRHTGWPPFWVPTREGIEPYMKDGVVECWIGGDPRHSSTDGDAAHSDFWRVSPNGMAFLLRGYEEDGPGRPASVFGLTLPVWRVGETLLHAEKLAANLIEGPATVAFTVHYEGLSGRSLVSLSGGRSVWEKRVSKEDAITLNTVVEAQSISANLPEILHSLLEPLYALFGFFQLPMILVVEEIANMRGQVVQRS